MYQSDSRDIIFFRCCVGETSSKNCCCTVLAVLNISCIYQLTNDYMGFGRICDFVKKDQRIYIKFCYRNEVICSIVLEKIFKYCFLVSFLWVKTSGISVSKMAVITSNMTTILGAPSAPKTDENVEEMIMNDCQITLRQEGVHSIRRFVR